MQNGDAKFLLEMRIAGDAAPSGIEAWHAEGGTLRAELVRKDAEIAAERAAKLHYYQNRNMWRLAAIAATTLLVLLIIFGRK